MVITFSSMKGGVGKSTDAVLLANNLAARGLKVLFFDMDTNNSSTIYYTLGIADEFPTKNVAEALSRRSVEGCVVRSRIENVDIVPSSLRLFDIRSIDYHALKKTLSETAVARADKAVRIVFVVDIIKAVVEVVADGFLRRNRFRADL